MEEDKKKYRRLKGLVILNSLREPIGGMNKSIMICSSFLVDYGIDIHFCSVANIYRIIRSLYRLVFLEKFLSFDFVCFNSIASFLTCFDIGIFLLNQCIKRKIPVFIYWHETDWVFKAIEYSRHKSISRIEAIASNPLITHLTVSKRCDDFIKNRFETENSQIVYNCTQINSFYEEIVEPSSPPVVLNIASIQERKGTDLFVDTAIKVCQENENVEFMWVGGGKTHNRLKELINKNKLAKRILFPGYIERPLLFLRRASVFYLSSRDDPFPLALLEAMCLGREIVAFDIGGVSEALKGSGTVVEPFNTDKAAAVILDKLEKKSKELMNRTVSQRYHDNFTPQHLAKRLNETIRNKIN